MAVKMRADPVKRALLIEALKAGSKRRFERKDERAKLSAAHTKKWQDPAESNRLTAQRKRQEKEKNAQAA
jgi:hypothetical protein